MRRRRTEAWYEDIPARLRFERGAGREFPGLGGSPNGRGRSATVTYRLKIEVPEYEARVVEVRLHNTSKPILDGVYVDGPTDSPHRYHASGGGLCMWYPSDPDENKWVGADGLLALLTHVRLHLFREAYWRETGHWPGPQAPHAVDLEKAA